jgi:hypothetical protein
MVMDMHATVEEQLEAVFYSCALTVATQWCGKYTSTTI